MLASVQAEEQGQAVPASGELAAARSVEATELAASVEDRQEEKEHREFEQAWTSFKFEIVTSPGCMPRGAKAEPCRRLGVSHEHFPTPEILFIMRKVLVGLCKLHESKATTRRANVA